MNYNGVFGFFAGRGQIGQGIMVQESISEKTSRSLNPSQLALRGQYSRHRKPY